MAPYIIRIGPFDETNSNPGEYSYVALADQDDMEGVHGMAVHPDDEAGLSALLKVLAEPPRCEPVLAKAAAKLGLPVGPPIHDDTVTWWRHGLTLSIPIGASLEGVKQLDQVMQFALASAGFLRAGRFLEQHHLTPFKVFATGKVEREAMGLLLTSTEGANPTLGFCLFEDEAHFDWLQRLVNAGMSEDFVRVDALHCFQDTRDRPYLREALAWANLPHPMLAARIAEQKAAKVRPDELMLLTGILNALSELGAEKESAVETEISEEKIEVEVEVLEPLEPTEVAPGAARA